MEKISSYRTQSKVSSLCFLPRKSRKTEPIEDDSLGKNKGNPNKFDTLRNPDI